MYVRSSYAVDETGADRVPESQNGPRTSVTALQGKLWLASKWVPSGAHISTGGRIKDLGGGNGAKRVLRRHLQQMPGPRRPSQARLHLVRGWGTASLRGGHWEFGGASVRGRCEMPAVASNAGGHWSYRPSRVWTPRAANTRPHARRGGERSQRDASYDSRARSKSKSPMAAGADAGHDEMREAIEPFGAPTNSAALQPASERSSGAGSWTSCLGLFGRWPVIAGLQGL
ncbi:hypothetical protein B0J14DRAFT_557208 [Halenospora varia]|nr:hypothetical protein B0J14DRAFT_557208 [Halenospora varia]